MDAIDLNAGWVSALVAALASLAGALGAGRIGARSALRRDIELRRRNAAEEAAREIVAGLHVVRELVTRSATEAVAPAEVTEALSGFQKAWDRQSHRLPDNWPSFSRELMYALGEHFGGAGWSHVFPGSRDAPIAPFDATWWENAERYVRYLAHWTARWGDEPDRVTHVPHGFDAWLDRKAAREAGPPVPFVFRLLTRTSA